MTALKEFIIEYENLPLPKLNYLCSLNHINKDIIEYVLCSNTIKLSIRDFFEILHNKNLHNILEHAIQYNPKLKKQIIELFRVNIDIFIFFTDNDNSELIRLLITLIPNLHIARALLVGAILTNNIELIDILHDHFLDLHTMYEQVMHIISVNLFDMYELDKGYYDTYKINLETITYLEKYRFDIHTHADSLCIIFCANSNTNYFQYLLIME